MQGKLGTLKYLVDEIEHSFHLADRDKIDIQIKKIRELLNEIEAESRQFPIREKVDIKKTLQDDVKMETLEVVKYPHKKINNIPFLVKSTKEYEGQDIYDGNFLERFCDMRTQDLMNAKCINHHNVFWKQHQTIHGNVYGSVPKELISEESVNELKKFKWEVVNVDIYDFGKKAEDQELIIKACRTNFKKYILVIEKSTDAYLALVFQ